MTPLGVGAPGVGAAAGNPQLLAALAARAPAGGMTPLGAGAPGVGGAAGNPQLLAAPAARDAAAAGGELGAVAPGHPQGAGGPGAGFARGGRVVPQKGMTTGPIKRSANKIAPLQGMTTGPVPRSGGKVVPRKGTTGPIERTPERSFDSTRTAPGNLATKQSGRKMARGGVSEFDSLKSVGGNLPLQRQAGAP